MKVEHHGELGIAVCRFGFVQTEGEVVSFVESDVFEGHRVVINDRNVEVHVHQRATVDRTIAKDLEDAHAVFYYVREGAHFGNFVCGRWSGLVGETKGELKWEGSWLGGMYI